MAGSASQVPHIKTSDRPSREKKAVYTAENAHAPWLFEMPQGELAHEKAVVLREREIEIETPPRERSKPRLQFCSIQ